MSGSALPDNVLEIINAAVTQAVTQAVQQTRQVMQAAAPPSNAPERDYYKIMEKLLYNYPALKRLVADKAAYTSVELQERSKSIVGFNLNATRKNRDEIIEDLERDKENEYNTTFKDFRRIERVIQLHKNRKEFVVVRLYYFNEGLDGMPHPSDAPPPTWDDVALDLERDTKTVRRWRNKIVSDMAVCLFGIEAATQSGTIREAY